MAASIPKFYRLELIILLLLTAIGAHAQNGDITLLRNINLHRNRALDPAMILITNSTYPVTAAIPVAGLIAGYTRHDTQMIRSGWATIAGMAVTEGIVFGLKYTVNRTRPYVTYPDLQPYQRDTDPSFPSGHTTFAFYSATSLSIYYPKWYVITPSYLWACAVGYSRIDLGVHYPTDVLAGAVIGTGTAWLVYQGNKWLQHRRLHRNLSS